MTTTTVVSEITQIINDLIDDINHWEVKKKDRILQAAIALESTGEIPLDHICSKLTEALVPLDLVSERHIRDILPDKYKQTSKARGQKQTTDDKEVLDLTGVKPQNKKEEPKDHTAYINHLTRVITQKDEKIKELEAIIKQKDELIAILEGNKQVPVYQAPPLSANNDPRFSNKKHENLGRYDPRVTTKRLK
jgi:hypothetical protein